MAKVMPTYEPTYEQNVLELHVALTQNLKKLQCERGLSWHDLTWNVHDLTWIEFDF